MISWGYGAFCEGVFNGQTPGKRSLSLRVVSEQGVPITGAQAVLRNLVGAVDGLIPFCYLIGLSSMLLTQKFQRLGDLAAGTMVIVEDRRPRLGLVQIKDPRAQAILDRSADADRGRLAAGRRPVRLRSPPAPFQPGHVRGAGRTARPAAPRPLRPARYRARRRRPLRGVSSGVSGRMSTLPPLLRHHPPDLFRLFRRKIAAPLGGGKTGRRSENGTSLISG